MTLNNEIAYYLGFLAADGWVTGKTLGFALKREDRKAVEYIASITSKLCGTDIDIKDYESKSSNGKYYPASKFTITHAPLIEWLEYFNIIPAKSYSDADFMENIPDEYKFAFIAGYFDGDGGVSYNEESNVWIISITGRLLPMSKMNEVMGNVWHYRKVYDSETYVMSLTKSEEAIKWINKYIELKQAYGIKLLQRKVDKLISLRDNLISRSEAAKNRISNPTKYFCPICGKERHYNAELCRECYDKRRRANIPDKDTLVEQLRESNFTRVGKIYGVSANAVKKWAIGYGIYNRDSCAYTYNNKDILKTFLKTLSIKETAQVCNIPDWKVGDILDKMTDGRYKEFISTGQPIVNSTGMAFVSTTKASEYLGVARGRGHITACAKGERRNAYGYEWFFITPAEFAEFASNDNDGGLNRNYRELLKLTV